MNACKSASRLSADSARGLSWVLVIHSALQRQVRGSHKGEETFFFEMLSKSVRRPTSDI